MFMENIEKGFRMGYLVLASYGKKGFRMSYHLVKSPLPMSMDESEGMVDMWVFLWIDRTARI